MNEIDCLKIFIEEEWIELKGLYVATNVQDTLLDLVIVVPSSSLILAGIALDLKDRTEDFRLKIAKFDPNKWWKSKDGQPSEKSCPIKRFKTDWIETKHLSLLTPPRTVRFFGSPTEPDWVKPPATFLGKCRAIEFSKQVDGEEVRAVFLSSDNYPCSLEFATEPEACKKMLEGLIEIPFTLGDL